MKNMLAKSIELRFAIQHLRWEILKDYEDPDRLYKFFALKTMLEWVENNIK